MSLQNDLVTDLTTELQIADEKFNSTLLSTKVTNAIRDVKEARRYPETYTETKIENDLTKYYSKIREIALFDYAHVGAYGETQRNEDGINRVYVERDKLFNGINAISNF